MALIDQATKRLAESQLSQTERVPLIGDLLGLQLAYNPGAVLSLGSESTWALTVLGLLATVALVVAALRTRSLGWATVIGIIGGGAVGNLLDRLFHAPAFGRGEVTDFIAYGSLFIGNIADVALAIGVGLGLLGLLRSSPNARPHRTEKTGDT
ncbi:signal peptidase II [Naasia lichenicola]|uniref:signal peptidase II n=1 Tax=Naasia lichenicola TaxID=2565933 RepID=UPI001E442245|nr:signal peptidase II [Naasia lichenicola]